MDLPQFDYAAAFDALSAPYAILDRDLRFVTVNRCYEQIVMRSQEELAGNHIFDMFPESEARQRLVAGYFARALAGEEAELSENRYTIPDPEGGPDAKLDIWWNVHCSPIRDRAGNVTHMGIRVENVTEKVRNRHLADAINRELQHRVGNLFAMIATIARRTARDDATVAEFLPGFLDRLHALAETNAMLTGSEWNGLTLRRLLKRQLGGLTALDGDAISIDGPDILLSPSDAQLLSMALHELATNALKHGALAHEDGRLRIVWTLAGQDGYRLDWQEDGLRGVRRPTRPGFGTTLLTRILPRQLGGQVAQDFTPTSHRFHLSVDSPRRG